MEPEVKFVGVKIPPKTSVPVDESLEPGTYFSTLHITQFALAENARPGRNTISLKTPHGETFVLGTLQKDRCEQFQADFMLSGEVEVINSGDTEVHLTGYQTLTSMELADGSPSLSEDDEYLKEQMVLNSKALEKAWKAQAARQDAGGDSDDEEDDSDFDEDQESDDEEDEDEDDDEDEVNLETLESLIAMEDLTKGTGQKRGKRKKAHTAGEQEDDDADLLDGLHTEALTGNGVDSEDGAFASPSSSNEDDEEVPEAVAIALPKPTASIDSKLKEQQRKRTIEQAEAPSSKKAKSVASKEGSPDEQWKNAIQDYIAKQGPTKLGSLGSLVKKPAGVEKKLKRLITESTTLTIAQGDVVSLAS